MKMSDRLLLQKLKNGAKLASNEGCRNEFRTRQECIQKSRATQKLDSKASSWKTDSSGPAPSSEAQEIIDLVKRVAFWAGFLFVAIVSLLRK